MARNTINKRKVLHVPETEAYDDDLTQMEEEIPRKRQCVEDHSEHFKEDDSMALFENNSQDWDDNNIKYQTRDKSTNTTNLNLTESGTQTNNTDNSNYIQRANEGFGVFIGCELQNVPIFKRRFIMYQMIKLIENNSQNI
ncbi:uncharacterized protein LOC128199572 [Bicyclus anynana]|uniref:Uncharacterized protein LOC128199572 n=1 Tax=Bicyclus anynana TaxID=110368 RepID=A0ABM3M3T4_BICAN|nr:uncharacterized protein LOC128199572 [Bicyclus anynana]